MSILFADDINFHSRGFPELFSYIRSHYIKHEFHNYGNRGLKNSFGLYDPAHKNLKPYIDRLTDIPVWDWQFLEIHGIRLYDMARYEILSRAMIHPRWYDQQTQNDSATVFAKLAGEDYDLLLTNLAAAWFWVDHWEAFFAISVQKYNYFCVFGNSLTYSRAGAHCAHRAGILPYAFEHILTGQHHFIEPRLSPIQGCASLRLKIPANITTDRILVSHMLGTMKNKNVSASKLREENFFRNGEKTILLLTQVVNDFSLLVDSNMTLGSVGFYKELIGRILDGTSCNILVKTHPYEARKLQGENITNNEIGRYIENLSPDKRRRIRLLCDYPLQNLFSHSDCAVTLSSQSGLEALYHGLPVCLLSDAFYARHGFTHDFHTIDAFVRSVVGGQAFLLDDAAIEEFYRFMSWILTHLIAPSTTAETFRGYFQGAKVQDSPAFPASQYPDEMAKKERSLSNILIKYGLTRKKMKKLVTNPALYFKDAKRNRERRKMEAINR